MVKIIVKQCNLQNKIDIHMILKEKWEFLRHLKFKCYKMFRHCMTQQINPYIIYTYIFFSAR